MCFTNKLPVSMLVLLFLTISFSSAADTISANNSLSGDETLISKGEIFEFVFFKAGNSSNYFIGIWYKKYSSNPPTVVWIANRGTPVSDRFSSELKFIDGNLVLLNESKLPIWSTNVTSTTSLNSAVAVILDNGNLVVRDGLNSVEHIWQSFDHPAHTWLPGAKFAYNKRTNKSQLLTSWKSRDDPGVGLFSSEVHPSRIMVVSKWNRSHQYWDPGSWDPLMDNGFYKYNYQTNENESYFTYYAYNPSTICRFIMDVAGQFQLLTWSESTKQWNIIWAQPETQCKVYALCGAFSTCRETGLSLCNCLTGFQPRSESNWNQCDFSGGCVRKTNLICGRNMEKLDFVMVQVTSPPPSSSVSIGSAGECRNACLNDCSCNAYSFVGKNCSVWNGELLNLSEDKTNGKTMYVKVSSEDLPSHKKNCRVATMVIVVASVGGLLLVLGLVVLTIYMKKRRLAGIATMEGSLVFPTVLRYSSGSSRGSPDCRESCCLEETGVDNGRQSVSPVRCSKSHQDNQVHPNSVSGR
ncbi:putative non-specific serine/threonine protein kinase [Helianthus debilis subsp. tardiflorus]